MQRHQIGLDRPIVAAATDSTQQVTPLTAAMRTLIVNSLLEAGNTANRIAADVSDLNSTLRAWHQRLQVAVNDAAEARKNSIEQLAIRTRAETSHERQRLWLAAILRRGTSGTVNAFLDLAGDPAIAPAAFEAAKEADSRTIDKLFEALQSSRVATRQTAAQVFGALNRPQVSQRFAQMAMESSRSPRSADRAIEQFRSRGAQVCGRCATRFRNRPVASSTCTFLTLRVACPSISLSWSSDMKTTSRDFLCAFVLGLVLYPFSLRLPTREAAKQARTLETRRMRARWSREFIRWPISCLQRRTIRSKDSRCRARMGNQHEKTPTTAPRRAWGAVSAAVVAVGALAVGALVVAALAAGGRFQRGAGRKTTWQFWSRGHIFSGRQWSFYRLAGGCV